MPEAPTPTKEFHYFLSSVTNWIVDEDLFRGLRLMKKLDAPSGEGCVMYCVPLPIDAPYPIDHYAPIVHGVKCLGAVQYNLRSGSIMAKADSPWHTEKFPLGPIHPSSG